MRSIGSTCLVAGFILTAGLATPATPQNQPTPMVEVGTLSCSLPRASAAQTLRPGLSIACTFSRAPSAGGNSLRYVVDISGLRQDMSTPQTFADLIWLVYAPSGSVPLDALLGSYAEPETGATFDRRMGSYLLVNPGRTIALAPRDFRGSQAAAGVAQLVVRVSGTP